VVQTLEIETIRDLEVSTDQAARTAWPGIGRGRLPPDARRLPCAPLVAPSLTGPAAAQSSEVVITFAYTLVEDQLSPHSGQVRSQWTRTYRLSGKNLIGQTIALNGQPLETTNTALGHSGSGVSAVNGLSYSVESHVVSGTITLLEDAPSFRTRTVLRTNGAELLFGDAGILTEDRPQVFRGGDPGSAHSGERHKHAYRERDLHNIGLAFWSG
jgi:hypothetical protein